MSQLNDEEQKRLIILLQSQVGYLLIPRLSHRPEFYFDKAKTASRGFSNQAKHRNSEEDDSFRS